MPGLEHILRTGKSVGEICEAVGFDPEVSALASPELAPLGFVDALREGEKLIEAVGFLAHALPKREAIWWAWSCARDSAGEEASEAVQASLEATGRWIHEPTDENRRAAFDAAQKADVMTAAGSAGAAAFFAGDSLGPPDQPPMPPEEFMAAKAIAGSLLLAASVEPEETFTRLAEFLDRGLEVAERVHLWHPPEA